MEKKILLPLWGIRISPFDSALTRVISRAGSAGSDARRTAQVGNLSLRAYGPRKQMKINSRFLSRFAGSE